MESGKWYLNWFFSDGYQRGAEGGTSSHLVGVASTEKMVEDDEGRWVHGTVPSVGAFNLSLVRGCAHYCKLNSRGNLRRVTATSATVICPRTGPRVYVKDTVKNGPPTRCPSSWIQDLWSSSTRHTLRSLPEVINLASSLPPVYPPPLSPDWIFIDDTGRYLFSNYDLPGPQFCCFPVVPF